MRTTVKTLTVTPPQIQNFIYLLDGAPALLLDFYFDNHDMVFDKKSNWTIPMNTTCKKWLKAELKSYIKSMQEEIDEVGNGKGVDPYWIDEAKENKNRIKLAQRVVEKLN